MGVKSSINKDRRWIENVDLAQSKKSEATTDSKSQEPRAKCQEQRAKSKMPRAKSKE